MHSFGVIWIRISDPRSLKSWCIKWNKESTLVTDSLVPLMHYDLWVILDHWSILIQITSKECTLRFDLEILLFCILFIIFRVVLACLDVAITAAYNCSSSVSVVGDSCLVRGDILQCQARVVDICTDDPQCKWRILLFLCRGVCKKMTCTLRILNNDETF